MPDDAGGFCGRKELKGPPMRRVFCALMLLGLATPAAASDFDIPAPSAGPNVNAPPGAEADFGFLRGAQTVGPATFTRWTGFYVGGDFGYNYTIADFSGATQPLLAYSLRQLLVEIDDLPSSWPVLGNANTGAIGYGAFLGYNTQWQDLLLGIEGNYTHTSLTAIASTSPIGFTTPSRVVSVGSTGYDIAITGTGRLTLTDYGEARARAGLVLGNFLPYGFVGAVVGGGSYSVTTLADLLQSTLTPPFPCTPNGSTCQFFSFPNSAGQSMALYYGASFGAGLDWALTPNVFLRGEVEYVVFAPIAGITFSLVKTSVGAGFKF
jgi:outer membrane immunogenic protein